MQTWQMANDQFLESQRLQMMDLRRMESVLTEEQQRQVMELQKKDHEREEQERLVKELEEMREKHNREVEERIGRQPQVRWMKPLKYGSKFLEVAAGHDPHFQVKLKVRDREQKQ